MSKRGKPTPIRWKTTLTLLGDRINVFSNHASNSSNNCWAWNNDLLSYGRISIKGVLYLVHRIAWVVYHKDDLLPDELILHHCDNPGCINPAHLYKGSHSDNRQDAWDRDRFDRSMYAVDHGIKAAKGQGKKVLSDMEISKIRELYTTGKYTQYELADMFESSQGVVWHVIHYLGRFSNV